MAVKKSEDRFSDDEAQRRFETALHGAFKTPAPPKNVTLKNPKAQEKTMEGHKTLSVMEKIYADGSEAAKVVFEGDLPTVECMTLQEAALYLLGLEPSQQALATIQTKSGRKFRYDDMKLLHDKKD